MRYARVDRSSATTVSTGYAMFFGGLLMLGARLGDRFGHRRTIIASLVGFAAASCLAEALLPFSLGVVAGSTLAAPVLRRVRPARTVTMGLALIAAADGPTAWRSAASGVLNTAAQLGTAIGIAILLPIASATTGVTGHAAAGPVIAWTVAGIVAAAGALIYLRRTASLSQPRPRRG